MEKEISGKIIEYFLKQVKDMFEGSDITCREALEMTYQGDEDEKDYHLLTDEHMVEVTLKYWMEKEGTTLEETVENYLEGISYC